jgi:TRAP-type mannitol/chloroaromatic compound transport system permease large subunit
MTTLLIGILFIAATLLVMFSGMPIAFGLGGVALVFMASFMPAASLDTVAQNVYEEMASITLLSIPLFILKGAAIGRSRAGADLYTVVHVWLGRLPGGLAVANVLACGLFAAMAARVPRRVRRSAAPGFPRCAGAATRPASRPVSSRRAAPSASCCRPRSR